MRSSQVFISTIKETPADAEIISHQLMLRAGLIRRLSSGLYTWLPLGLTILRKAEHIIRDEMRRVHGQEVLMPSVQPAELWQESQRWEKYGDELLRLSDRHDRAYCFGPTHEEVITDLVRNEIRSYKQLPITFYQIQTKFRDEIRPRFGLMRAREFLMKDAYSFHLNQASLQSTYEAMYSAYCRIFERMGLHYRAVEADTGSIGGKTSHEFHVLAQAGEDTIAYSQDSDYASNVELAVAMPPSTARPEPSQTMHKVATPDISSIEAVCQHLAIDAKTTIKTLLVEGEQENSVIALVLRGDHTLNAVKAEKLPLVKQPLTLATDEQIQTCCQTAVGFIGPVQLTCPVIADHSAAVLADFVCGANQQDYHYRGANWGRDIPEPMTADIRNVISGDPSPDGHGQLSLVRGIEVGHIFQLGQQYSQQLKANVLDESGKAKTLTMGCYGIGVSRVIAAAIEQHHDERGIIWPAALAPFQCVLIPINAHKSIRLKQAAETLYDKLRQAGIDILLEDRGLRPGVCFADMELIGIPHRLVLSEKSLDDNVIEYKRRHDGEEQTLSLASIVTILPTLLE